MKENFEVEQSALNILKSLLPQNWRYREQHPDVHIDYVVEIPSGIFFGIQSKGRQSISQKKDQIKIQFSTKQLKYYLDDVKIHPVFIIVVDVTNRKAYWLFTQKYLKEEVRNKNWSKQKTVTLFIKTKNIIDDHDKFKQEVLNSIHYMKELWPSSIEASFKKEKEYLKSLDPRFKDIEISTKGNSINYHFHSDESFDINFKVKNGIKLKEYFNNPDSDRITFDSKDVEVTGSELMKLLLKKADQIEFKLDRPVFDVDLYLLVIENDRFFPDSLHLNGELTFHKTYIKIDCSLKSSPLKIQVIIYLDFAQNPTFNFYFDFSVWVNKPVKFLPFLEKLDSYFSKLKRENNALIKIEYMGNDLFTARPKMKNYPDFIGFTDEYFALCKKLKSIDSHYNLNLLFPGFDKIKRADLNDIEELYNLITTGECKIIGRKLTGSFSVEKKEGFLESYSKGIDIRLVSDGRYNFLGKEINIGSFAIDISRPKLLISHTEMLELFKSDKEYVPLRFTTDENSKVFYRLLPKTTK